MANARTRPILVGVDGSPESVAAARWAAAEARLRRCPLHIVCVYSWPAPLVPLSGLPAEVTEDSLREDANAVVRSVTTAIDDALTDITLTASAIAGLPAFKLIDLSGGVTMVVVVHRGHGGFAALRLGSVAANVAAHASSPVAIIRTPSPTSPTAETVLVGVDGSDASEAVLDFAFAEASRRGCNLTALTAWERSFWPTSPDVATWTATAAHGLQRLLKPWRQKFPDVAVEELAVPDRPAAALLDAARDASLLVIGSRGHGGFRGLLLGSVSQQAINYAPCPVVVVR